MSHRINITIDPDILHDREKIRTRITEVSGFPFEDFKIVRRSVDARSKKPRYTLQVELIGKGDCVPEPAAPAFRPVRGDRSVLIVGAGPAGLFAALTLIEQGIKPIVLERGKPVEQRSKDIAMLLRHGSLDAESNYCFGEGGAGTFSDGKLYTRSTKRGDVREILDIFIAHGAHEEIRIDAHPHIGSNRLPAIVKAMRRTLISCGGEIHFDCRVTDFLIRDGRILGVMTDRGRAFDADAVILAMGHSSRDIYDLFQKKNFAVLPKAFAVGVRVEHPQALIDTIQYHQSPRHPNLPPAAYRFTSRIEGRGVYSFCMCPGGHIIPAGTNPEELVVNGMSNAARNAPFANSGIVVEVRLEDIESYHAYGSFAFLAFQQELERRAFQFGGALGQQAPAQRMTDFIHGRLSASLPGTSYLPGIQTAPLHELFPPFLARRLANGLADFGKKRKGFVSEEALLLAVESRTSAPVTIPRDDTTLMHPDLKGLYPCGEGAGYAGGIVSSAMDGRQVAMKVSEGLNAGGLTGKRAARRES